MTVKVLVVDDSAFFRRRVTEILEDNANIKVIGSANNGEEAVSQSRVLKPDVITMDIEMPVMNGIDAVKAIMSSNPCPILMFSSLTHEGATATLNALEAGAADFLPKKFEDIARNRDEAVKTLQDRVLAIARQPVSRTPARPSPAPAVKKPAERPDEPKTALERIRQRNQELQSQRESDARTAKSAGSLTTNRAYQILAIGTSTGGPVALQKILTQLPANFPYPIVMVQHMPAAFTKAFAQRLNGLCQVNVKEAEDGDVLRAGTAYLAPGGKQLMVEGRPGSARLRVKDDTSGRITYKPSVDLTFASLSKTYMGKVLGVILTGMGADGRDGSRMLKDQGATIWAQDQASCVVYGMPQAVAQAGISTRSISLDDMARMIMKEVGYSGL
ncbi:MULTISPECIES: protein-glutamate methylesterase/protein-glutamine glutaminase [Idiomarina]|jgi:two-component system chemotaxis response regulator CheB|uniref:protein-glutamate methylesterase/protein-glutamine glutaminase n=1 Tax=Idiomarina TaxID=135575 RepID=UPI0006C88809|nr:MULTISPECIES: chemotaxis response regulator protein-glutamate methylesterase [Idiomarina]KPD22156.1 chemotaxis protein CheY [Idiomarina abyssalis]RDX35101.1 chemotaxis response regulator protein-glutamate methylesterase [Idiomarina sp. HD9-110m-PIT-SAG05]SFT35432.1 two-component system, chemotaxis family, response regulator CheB [Idiomarina abyssalis]